MPTPKQGEKPSAGQVDQQGAQSNEKPDDGFLVSLRRHGLGILIALLILLWLASLAMAIIAILIAQGETGASETLRWSGRAAEALVCVVPFLLSLCLAALPRGQEDRLDYEIGLPQGTPGNGIGAEIRAIWNADRDRLLRERFGFTGHSLVFGVLVSLVLSCSAVLMLYSYRGLHAPENEQIQSATPTQFIVAVGLAAATAVCFAFNFGQFLRRAARRDVSSRMVGAANRSLFNVILTAVLMTAIVGSTAKDDDADMVMKALLIGMACGLLGDRVVETVFEAVSIVFGTASGDEDNFESFEPIEGLSDSERLRLSEQGINSLQALAFSSPAMLFFSTRYEFDRICDWQDQALLVVKLGKEKANSLRTNFGFRGAADALTFIEELVQEGKVKVSDDCLLKLFPFPCGTESAKAALKAFKDDSVVKRASLWKQCVPMLAGSTGEQDDKSSAVAPGLSPPGEQPGVSSLPASGSETQLDKSTPPMKGQPHV